jgi:hypothetical protein
VIFPTPQNPAASWPDAAYAQQMPSAQRLIAFAITGSKE